MALDTSPGASTAESYVSVSDFQAYCQKVGYDLAGKADAELEQALRRGTRGIDGLYGPRFIGAPVTVSQALEWPRIGAVWRGAELPDDEIPQKVKDAACEAAWRELSDPGSMQPDLDRGGKIKQMQAGSVNMVFADGAPAETTFAAIDGLLAGLVRSKTTSTVGFVGRA